jgi:hypothetical protein
VAWRVPLTHPAQPLTDLQPADHPVSNVWSILRWNCLQRMDKSTHNSGKPCTAADRKALNDRAKQNTPTRVIGLKLGRTP